MIMTVEMLKDKYKDYNNIFEKIRVEEKNNRLIKLKRSLYTNNINESPFLIANVLYNPSYISFETALDFNNVIPERVNIIISATFKKNRTKVYNTEFGTFYYQDINKKAYPYGIEIVNIDGNDILIASKEKALTDTISTLPPRNSIKEIEKLLFDDLRVNEFVFDEMDKKLLSLLCDLYPSENLKLLQRYIRRNI